MPPVHTSSPLPLVNALSFDIEDWFHLMEIPAVADSSRWPQLPSLVERYTEWILQTLEQHQTRATFFILGWVAQQHPQVVRMISQTDHEIGLHSFWHRRIDQLSPDEFREDIRRNLDAVGRHTSRPILGFRAPSFSITPGAEWAFDVLLDLGLKYDTSLFPARRLAGGYLCPRQPHIFHDTPSGRPIREFPLSVMRWGPVKLPFCGGGYMRLLPSFLIRHCFNHFNRRGIPVVVYLHPRDFASDCPRVPMPLHRRFKSYVGLRTTKGKLRMLLNRYRFDTCQAVLGLSDRPAAATP